VEKQARIKSLDAEPAVEFFDKAVFTRLVGPDKVELHAALISQASIALRQNFAPLPTLIDCGSPRFPLVVAK